MKVRIECIDKESLEVTGIMEKTLGEYSEWLERAVLRDYEVTESFNIVSVHGGRGKNNFIVVEP